MKVFERQFLVLVGDLALSVDLDQGLAQLEPFAVYHWNMNNYEAKAKGRYYCFCISFYKWRCFELQTF
jgi:hypothetical protein